MRKWYLLLLCLCIFPFSTQGLPQKTVEQWIQDLKSSDPQKRIQAAKALAKKGTEKAIAPLFDAFDDPNWEVQKTVFKSLEQIGKTTPKAIFPELLKALKGSSDKKAACAFALLKVLEQPLKKYIPLIAEELPNIPLSRHPILIHFFSNLEKNPKILKALQKEWRRFRESKVELHKKIHLITIIALWKQGDRQAELWKDIKQALFRGKEEHQILLLHTLSKTKTAARLAPYTERLKKRYHQSTNWLFQAMVLKVFSQMPPKKGREGLELLFEFDKKYPQKTLDLWSDYTLNLPHVVFVFLKEKLKKATPKEVERILWVLSGLETKFLEQRLSEILPDLSSHFQKGIAREKILKFLKDFSSATLVQHKKTLLPILIQALQQKGKREILQTLWILQKIGKSAKTAAPHVRKLTTHSDYWIREEAKTTLKKIGGDFPSFKPPVPKVVKPATRKIFIQLKEKKKLKGALVSINNMGYYRHDTYSQQYRKWKVKKGDLVFLGISGQCLETHYYFYQGEEKLVFSRQGSRHYVNGKWYGLHYKKGEETRLSPHLIALSLHTPPTSLALRKIRKMRKLKVLILENLSDQEASRVLKALRHLKSLRYIRVIATSALRYFPHITHLSIHGYFSQKQAKFFSFFKKLRNLRYLEISLYSSFPPKAFRYIGYLKTLEGLNLTGVAIKDQALKHIGKLLQLKFLNLEYCRELTSQGIFHLKSLKNLEFLNLGYIKKLDDQIGPLFIHWKNLQVLLLNGSPVTDKIIPFFGFLKNLKKLGIYGTKISKKGKKQLREILPHVEFF